MGTIAIALIAVAKKAMATIVMAMMAKAMAMTMNTAATTTIAATSEKSILKLQNTRRAAAVDDERGDAATSGHPILESQNQPLGERRRATTSATTSAQTNLESTTTH